MAKTNRSLRVLVHPSLGSALAIQELRLKGNEVVEDYQQYMDYYDLILGPNCWRIVPGMENQIDLAVKAARRAKYGKKETKSE